MSAQVEQVEVEVSQLQDFTGLSEYRFSGDSETVSNKRNFLAAYRTQASVFHAAAIAGIARATVYRYLDKDPVFAEAFEDCKEDTIDSVETSVYHDARYGNNPLLKMFWLKAHRAKYRDRLQVNVDEVDEEIRQRLNSSPQLLPSMVIDTSRVDDSYVAIPPPPPPRQKEED